MKRTDVPTAAVRAVKTCKALGMHVDPETRAELARWALRRRKRFGISLRRSARRAGVPSSSLWDWVQMLNHVRV